MKKFLLVLTLLLANVMFMACEDSASTQVNDFDSNFTTETVDNGPVKGQSSNEDPSNDANFLGNPFNYTGLKHNELLEVILDKFDRHIYTNMSQRAAQAAFSVSIIEALLEVSGYQIPVEGYVYDGIKYLPGQEFFLAQAVEGKHKSYVEMGYPQNINFIQVEQNLSDEAVRIANQAVEAYPISKSMDEFRKRIYMLNKEIEGNRSLKTSEKEALYACTSITYHTAGFWEVNQERMIRMAERISGKKINRDQASENAVKGLIVDDAVGGLAGGCVGGVLGGPIGFVSGAIGGAATSSARAGFSMLIKSFLGWN